MFCKVSILLFSSHLNKITASMGRWSLDLIKPDVATFFERGVLKEFRILRYLHDTVTV